MKLEIFTPDPVHEYTTIYLNGEELTHVTYIGLNIGIDNIATFEINRYLTDEKGSLVIPSVGNLPEVSEKLVFKGKIEFNGSLEGQLG